jgi:putative addiction module CopG family antidote
MPEIERLTITMPPELTAVVRQAVETGDYASTSEVVRAALRDWKLKHALQIEELAALKRTSTRDWPMSPPAASKTSTRIGSSPGGGSY